MRAGFVSITFRQLSPERLIEVALANRLRGIEWGGDVHVPHGQIERAERIGRQTREAGLEVASYGSYYHFDECDPGSSENGPSMTSVLDTAQALGAPAIRLWPGRNGPRQMDPAVREAIVEQARTFAAAASDRGMRIDFEYHENTLTETPGSTTAFLKAIAHPAARTLWQPALQTSPADRLGSLRRVTPFLSNLHCNFFDQDPWPEVHSLAEGEEEWKCYLEALNPDPERWILIEHVKDHSEAQFREDAQALLRWIELYCK